MPLKKQLTTELQLAIKDQHHTKMDVIRGLLSSIAEFETSKNKKDFTEEEEIKLLKKEMKKRTEAIPFYEKANRLSSLEREKEELYILGCYMPKNLTKDELKELVEKTIKENEGLSEGKMIGVAMKRTNGRADGKAVKELVSLLMSVTV